MRCRHTRYKNANDDNDDKDTCEKFHSYTVENNAEVYETDNDNMCPGNPLTFWY